MGIMNTASKYGSISIFLHWLIAFLVILMLILGFVMQEFQGPLGPWLFNLHKSIGISVLILMLARLGWRLLNPIPNACISNLYQSAVFRFTQGAFYTLVIAMPLSGWLMATASNHAPHYFWLFTWRMPFVPIASRDLSMLGHELHNSLDWLLIGFITLHTLAALYHHFIKRDDTLKKMI